MTKLESSRTLIHKYVTISGVVAAYWIISISIVFINKTLFSSKVISLNAPLFVTWTQCIISALICMGWETCSKILPTVFSFPSSKPFQSKTIAIVLPVSILSVFTLTFGNLSLSFVDVSFYFITRSLTTVFNVVFTYLILKQTTSLKALLCCAAIILGFLLGIDQENFIGTLSPQGTIFGVLSSVTLSLYSIFTKKVLPTINNEAILLSYYNNIYSSILFIPLIVLNGELQQLKTFSFFNTSFWILTAISGVFGFLIGYCKGLCSDCACNLLVPRIQVCTVVVLQFSGVICKCCLCQSQTVRNASEKLMKGIMSGMPVKPQESDCCGSGCKPCVFDVYEEQLKKWKSKQEANTESKALNQMKYLPFLIKDIQNLGKFIKILQFQAVTLTKGNLNTVHIENAKLHTDFEILEEFLNIKPGEYLIMKGHWGSETISRSYTPVLNKDSFEKGAFTIIISLQPNGKMSGFFKKLQTDSIVFWRGPYRELTHSFNSFKHVLLFGGGTGIVPLYNIAKSIVEDEESETWVRIFASFKTTSNIILRTECGKLTDYWNFKMSVYITNEYESTFKAKYNESIMFGKIDEALIEKEVRKCDGDDFFIIVCGPEGFYNFIKNCLRKFGVKDENIFIFF